MAISAEPPVASMGVDDQADALVDILGHLAVILVRLVGDLVALHADVTHASGGHQVEDAVDHAKARTQDGHDGEFLAGKLFERGGSDGGLDLDVFHRQVAHGLVAVKKREFAHELAELVGAGVFVAQDRQLVLDERVIDKRHTGRIVGDGHGLIAPFVAAAKRPC